MPKRKSEPKGKRPTLTTQVAALKAELDLKSRLLESTKRFFDTQTQEARKRRETVERAAAAALHMAKGRLIHYGEKEGEQTLQAIESAVVQLQGKGNIWTSVEGKPGEQDRHLYEFESEIRLAQ